MNTHTCMKNAIFFFFFQKCDFDHGNLICLHAQLIITRDFTRFRLKKDMLCGTIAVFVSLHLPPPQLHVGSREIRRLLSPKLCFR